MNHIEVNEQIKQKHREILSLCLDLHEKGIDVFYTYNPHVDWADIRIYKDGWDRRDSSKDADESINLIWTKLPEDVVGDDIDQDDIDPTFKKLDGVISKLKGLL